MLKNLIYSILQIVFLLGITRTKAQNIPVKDSMLMESYLQTAKDTAEINPDKSIVYINQIIKYAKEHNYNKGYRMAYSGLGAIYQRKSDNKQALFYFQKSVEYARKGNNEKDLCGSLYNVAAINALLLNYDKAIGNATEALTIAIRNNDSLRIARCYKVMADCYYARNEIDKSISYIEKSADIFRNINKPKDLTKTLMSSAGIRVDKGDYSIALKQLSESEAIANSMEDILSLSNIYILMGACYDQLNQTSVAESYFLKGLDICKQIGNKLEETSALNYLGSLYLKEKKYALAEQYLLDALKMATETNSINDLKDIHGTLADLYNIKQDFKKAYYHKQQFAVYADAVMNEEKMKTAEELSIKFETQEMENKNKLLQQENALQKLTSEQKNTRKNIFLYILISLAVLLLASILFLYNYSKQKSVIHTNKTNELKQKLLLTQMNPHFIFNSVDNIQSLIYNKQDEQAINYLTKFSKLTRQILENSRENYISLAEELNMLDNYLTIQQLLYNNNFTYTITLDEAINPENLLVPPMLTQPFIENAIKHGLKNKTEHGKVAIFYTLKNSVLFFEVSDNGSGLSNNEDAKQQKSLSTQITRDRLAIIHTHKDINIQTQNIIGSDNSIQGVKTFFEIPYVYSH